MVWWLMICCTTTDPPVRLLPWERRRHSHTWFSPVMLLLLSCSVCNFPDEIIPVWSIGWISFGLQQTCGLILEMKVSYRDLLTGEQGVCVDRTYEETEDDLSHEVIYEPSSCGLQIWIEKEFSLQTCRDNLKLWLKLLWLFGATWWKMCKNNGKKNLTGCPHVGL